MLATSALLQIKRSMVNLLPLPLTVTQLKMASYLSYRVRGCQDAPAQENPTPDLSTLMAAMSAELPLKLISLKRRWVV